MYYKITSGEYKENLDKLFGRIDKANQEIGDWLEQLPGASADEWVGDKISIVKLGQIKFDQNPGKDWSPSKYESGYYIPKKGRKSTREVIKQMGELPSIGCGELWVALNMETDWFSWPGIKKMDDYYLIHLPGKRVKEFQVVEGVTELKYSDYLMESAPKEHQ